MPVTRLALITLALAGVIGSTASASLATRAPTSAERRAILAGLPKDPFLHQRCLRYDVRVSTVNPRYAYVAFEFPRRLPRGCRGFNGTSVMGRSATGRWRQVYAGSEFYCDGAVPERVIREFFKSCIYGESDHFYSPSRDLECVLRSHAKVLACVAFATGRSAYLYRSGAVHVHGPPVASFFRHGPGIELPPGQSWTCSRAGCRFPKPFACDSLKSGMRCYILDVNRPEHGFLISRQGIRRF